MVKFINFLILLPREAKIIIQFIIDFVSICLAFYISLFIRYESLIFLKIENIHKPIIYFIPLATLFLIFNKFYSYWLRYASYEIVIKTAIFSFLSFSFMIFMDVYFYYPILKSVSILFGLLIFIFFLMNKFFIKLVFIIGNSSFKENTIIYGLGEKNLNARYIFRYSKYKIIGFINHNHNSIVKSISGHQVIDKEDVFSFIKKNNVKNILINDDYYPNFKFIEKLSKKEINIKKFNEDLGINQKINLKNLSLEDLIGRWELDSKYSEDTKYLEGKVILVTGAGGSIGSNLFREILKHSPRKVICLDHNEKSVYDIEKKFQNHKNCIFYLGSILDLKLLNNIFIVNNINFVFHCAAYKHVNIVENNIKQSYRNNILGTKNLVKLSSKFKINKFTLISSDKAVKPSNAMGYSKYISEQITLAESKLKKTTEFNIVRFGNVIGSSGSVIPLFNDLINKNKNINITHKNVDRFFMSINEAVALILTATSINQSGKVYVLDMGKPIKILDIAKKMILLSGKKFRVSNRNKTNMYSEDIIQINFSGLRKGEKISEQLSESKLRESSKNKIFIAKTKMMKINDLNKKIKFLIN